MSVSGEFASVDVNSITIKPRIRKKKLTEAQRLELRDSIRRKGLIHPIIVTREHVLVAGENRLNECRELGWTHIPSQWSDTLDEKELLEIEIEENIKRVDLDWKDQCDAMLQLHEMYVEENNGWSIEDTAERIGYSRVMVTERLAVARELASGNERVQSAPKYSVAKNITSRQNERRRSDELASIKVAEEEPQQEEGVSPIQQADFLEWAYDYSGQPFNVIHCDFPYGIGADSFAQGAAASYGGYKDTFEHYENCINALVENKEMLMGESAHLIFWFSMKHYAYTLRRLDEHFWVDPYPLVWHKSDNKGTLPDPQRGPRRVYEVAFLCSHGDRKIIQPVSNTFSGPTQRTGEHMSEKSEDMLKHFMRMIVDGNTRLLDPTCGSGSALRSARSLGCNSLLGLELNPEYVDNARRAFEK